MHHLPHVPTVGAFPNVRFPMFDHDNSISLFLADDFRSSSTVKDVSKTMQDNNKEKNWKVCFFYYFFISRG